MTRVSLAFEVEGEHQYPAASRGHSLRALSVCGRQRSQGSCEFTALLDHAMQLPN